MGKRKGNGTNDESGQPKKMFKTVQQEKETEFDTCQEVKEIKVETFAENRALEIQALTEVVKEVGGNHMAFQKLPRNMRRRAMSHNLKRVPRRLHSIVKAEIEKTKAPAKRPSRKHRRRPKNLLSEYERRKRRIEWLETHIWHAKRFKMVEKWGCKLAHQPNDKSARACYRSAHNHCLIQDVSFEHYLEIKGPRHQIIDGLSHLTSAKTGLTFAAKLTSQGTKQGLQMIYCYDSYPYKAIGTVTFLWRPQLDQEIQTSSTLWICCHRSHFQSVLDEVTKCFDTGIISSNSLETHSGLLDKKNSVVVTSLKDELVKIRLFGPASNRVVAETLKLYGIVNFLEKEGSRLQTAQDRDNDAENNDITVQNQWWKTYFRSESALSSVKEQTLVWEKLMKCHSPGEAPPNCVIGLTLKDPRLLLPPKRSKVSVINSGCIDNCLAYEMFNTSVASSPLWDVSVRSLVKSTKLTEQKLNEMKSHNQIPGSPLELGEMESAIPVILVQRPGTDSRLFTSVAPNGFACGWDLILPSGWAMAFWVALVYRGARVGGLKEAHSLALLGGMLSAPVDYPDTAAGTKELMSQSAELELKYNRRPPAKRPNYIKLGIPSPFSFQFEKLVQDWKENLKPLCSAMPDASQYFVLRDRKNLQALNLALTDTKTFLKNAGKLNRSKGKATSSGDDFLKAFLSITGSSTLDVFSNAIVAVSLKTLHRGVPAVNGHICLPTKDDLKELSKNKNYGGPMEKKHKDPFKGERKKEKKERIKLKKKLKREKHLKKKRNERLSVNSYLASAGGGPEGIASEIENQLKSKNAAIDTTKLIYTSNSITLNPPSDRVKESDQPGLIQRTNGNEKAPSSNRASAPLIKPASSEASLVMVTSRSIIGFVCNGDFDLAIGQGTGTGFCSVLALLKLVESQLQCRHSHVLVRNPTSLQYRFASVSLIL
ncbi:hypothetical protein Btru_058724 [Bulinus truncatus]|nr:hypothetical protein Btru_058724 [Bulinus truncatus]